MSGVTAICLLGPTASGKTDIALRLADALPVELISVDSALVYRGMDIGTAKPDATTLARVPHRLIDICEPEMSYSAGAFVRDATAAIDEIAAAGRVPLLVGGTMMYFRALTGGMADLPEADSAVRAELDAEAAVHGWPALHRRLAACDPVLAARISCNDSQRIQRALEVWRLAGRPLSELQADGAAAPRRRYLQLALVPGERAVLHERIATRFERMLDAGFLDEVRTLRSRPGLSAEAGSMRAVGYRQLWAHVGGEYDLATARDRALAATRQLAKRQLTWLRSVPGLNSIDPLEAAPFDRILSRLRTTLDK